MRFIYCLIMLSFGLLSLNLIAADIPECFAEIEIINKTIRSQHKKKNYVTRYTFSFFKGPAHTPEDVITKVQSCEMFIREGTDKKCFLPTKGLPSFVLWHSLLSPINFDYAGNIDEIRFTYEGVTLPLATWIWMGKTVPSYLTKEEIDFNTLKYGEALNELCEITAQAFMKIVSEMPKEGGLDWEIPHEGSPLTLKEAVAIALFEKYVAQLKKNKASPDANLVGFFSPLIASASAKKTKINANVQEKKAQEEAKLKEEAKKRKAAKKNARKREKKLAAQQKAAQELAAKKEQEEQEKIQEEKKKADKEAKKQEKAAKKAPQHSSIRHVPNEKAHGSILSAVSIALNVITHNGAVRPNFEQPLWVKRMLSKNRHEELLINERRVKFLKGTPEEKQAIIQGTEDEISEVWKLFAENYDSLQKLYDEAISKIQRATTKNLNLCEVMTEHEKLLNDTAQLLHEAKEDRVLSPFNKFQWDAFTSEPGFEVMTTIENAIDNSQKMRNLTERIFSLITNLNVFHYDLDGLGKNLPLQ